MGKEFKVNVSTRSSILEYMMYSEEKKELEVFFKKGKWKGQKKVLTNLSKPVVENILESASIGRALLEVMGEQKYMERLRNKRSTIFRSQLFNFFF